MGMQEKKKEEEERRLNSASYTKNEMFRILKLLL